MAETPRAITVQVTVEGVLAAATEIREAIERLAAQNAFLLDALVNAHEHASLRGDDLESIKQELAEGVTGYFAQWPAS